jgi:hypothetical protein
MPWLNEDTSRAATNSQRTLRGTDLFKRLPEFGFAVGADIDRSSTSIDNNDPFATLLSRQQLFQGYGIFAHLHYSLWQTVPDRKVQARLALRDKVDPSMSRARPRNKPSNNRSSPHLGLLESLPPVRVAQHEIDILADRIP